MKSFKVLAIGIAIATIGIASCSTQPSEEIIKKVEVQAGYHAGIPQTEVLYVIEPTWGQAFDYAFKTGYTPYFLAGIFLLLAAGYFFYRKKIDKGIGEKNKPMSWLAFYLILAGLIVGGAACIHSKPAQIRFNNQKAVPEDQYMHYMVDQGTIQPIWDSLYNNNLIIGAAR